jgi:predicted dienelactone hydrolase
MPSTTASIAVAWAPIPRGEYEVGVATVTVGDPAGERPLTVDVWFPIAPAADTAPLAPQRYTLLPDVYYQSPTALAATPDQIAPGPFPLIVYSHGSNAIRYLHSAYTEFLAGHGYVVVAADHTGNTVFDLIAGAGTDADRQRIAFDRPDDVRRLVDAFTDPADATAGGFAVSVDADDVAVTGHSLGGYTSIASATGVTTEVGEVLPDDRVDAIITLAPAVGGALLTDERLAALDVPMMVIVGTDDATTPVDPNVTRLWDLTTNTPAYRVELVHGEHQTFTDFCSYQEAVPTLPAVPQAVVDLIDDYAVGGCSPGDIDHVRANDLTTTYALQFLDQVFHGGPAIDPALVRTPDDVLFQAR